MQIKKPMKAATLEDAGIEDVKWPVLASPKIDGIRCLMHPTLGAVTQSFKPVPNDYIREWLNNNVPSCLDGELCVTNEGGQVLDYNTTQSGVMSKGGDPDFCYFVFDCFKYADFAFTSRLNIARQYVNKIATNPTIIGGNTRMLYWPHTVIADGDSLRDYYTDCLEQDYEGVMIRSVDGPYKSGRSTLRQGYLLKIKPWEDAEGIIIDFEEQMHNENPDEKDLLGYTKRSSSKDGLIPAGTLGALILNTKTWGEVRVGGGNGLDHSRRKEIWDNRDDYRGKIVTFKYMAYGMQDKPRFPKYKGIRYD